MLVKFLKSGLVRLSSIVSSFLVVYYITNVLGVDDAGVFLYYFGIAVSSAVVLAFGLDNYFLRAFGSSTWEDCEEEVVACLPRLYVAVTVFSVVALFLVEVVAHFFIKSDLNRIFLYCFAFSVPAMSSSLVLGFSCLGVGRLALYGFYQGAGSNMVFVFFGVVFYFAFSVDVLVPSLAFLYLVSSNAVFASSFSLLEYKKAEKVRGGFRRALVRSRNYFASTLFVMIVQWFPLFVAGLFLLDREVAYYATAHRVSLLIGVFLVVINMVLAPRYAKLWSEGLVAEVHELSVKVFFLVVLLCFPVGGLVLYFSDQVMSLFGEDYVNASSLLRFLIVGQLVAAACGSVGYILNMTGNDAAYRNSSFIAAVSCVVVSLVAGFIYGLGGVVFASVFSLVLHNVLSLLYVKSRLGFWTFC